MEGKEAASPHATAPEVVSTISSLLQPAVGAAHVMQRVVAQQQLLHADIESLNDELQRARAHFERTNNTQHHELDMYCARLARCRSDVAVLFRQLTATKQRLLRVQRVLSQRKEEIRLENESLKERLVVSAATPDATNDAAVCGPPGTSEITTEHHDEEVQGDVVHDF
ncbi:hypothetical protein DQ04_00321070 [Trypanosoma grayi]|uniref:hypothetical protein n=1 Tax=Trypanosoma grayi TaxID=71804 RepID=UPI0004F428C7|nr:hypothetical protein DQ04_00321070 [Trypanosoma grayi]KEG14738.1 hypothetical protein DQ04_00321070 [Trypanosoma grayi]